MWLVLFQVCLAVLQRTASADMRGMSDVVNILINDGARAMITEQHDLMLT